MDLFQLLFELVGSNVIHGTQFVDLSQSQFGFTQIAQLRLAVVLCNILITVRGAFVEFVEDHVNIYYAGVIPGTAPGAAAPGAPNPAAGC